MAFKMNGSPAKMGTISGTTGHSSALKMKAASALKQMELTREDLKGSGARIKDKDQESLIVSATGTTYGGEKGDKTKLDPSKKHHKAILETRWKKGDKASGGSLNELVKQRKGLKKGTAEYAEVQNKINKALGSKKVHKATVKSETKTETKTVKPTKKEVATSKRDVTVGEAEEKLEKRTAQLSKREARKKYGKGSKEHLEAKKAHLEAKEADRTGAKGGRKQSFFGKLSSRINKRRQEKIDKKLAEKESSPTKNMKTGKYKQKFEK